MKTFLDELKALSGTFWSELYPSTIFSDLIEIFEIVNRQTLQEAEELKLCINRATTPVYKKELYYPLILKEQSSNSFFISDKFISVPLITDKIQNPVLRLYEDIDFCIYKGTITFQTSPFSYNIPKEFTYSSEGTPVSSSIVLWALGAFTEAGYLKDLWGSVIAFERPSSPEYKTLLCNAYSDILKGVPRDEVIKNINLLG